MSINSVQFAQMLARVEQNSGRMPVSNSPVLVESDLHQDIIDLCKRRGWFYVRSRMDRKSTQAAGVPDFIVAADDGKTFWIEAKAKGNKPSNEQLATITFLKAKGHIAGLAYNMTDVMELVAKASGVSVASGE